jgi:release factor glutamine methyltransferase
MNDTVQDYLTWATKELVAAGVEDADKDARVLMAFALRMKPYEVTLERGRPLDGPAAMTFRACLQQRKNRRPISKIINRRAFWSHEFHVTDDVLDPRPETETLVAEALREPFQRVLDLGTGSGCILISLLMERPGATGLGLDLSEAALGVARLNAMNVIDDGVVRFAQGSWYDPVDGRFDLIVANPPYIAEKEMDGLAPEVRDWDPWIALTPGGDGLAAYRLIVAGAPAHLEPGGRLIVEIGPIQGAAVKAMFSGAGLVDVRTLPDMDGRDRVVAGRMADRPDVAHGV